MNLIDGKKVAEEILESLTRQVRQFPRKIGLAFLLVGNNAASLAYVRMKKKACARIGIHSIVQEFAPDTSQDVLLRAIHALNSEPHIDGILVQLPLPSHIDTLAVTRSILPEKDVDGFHPVNLGKLLLGEEDGFPPCTPRGIQLLLERTLPIEGKHVVIVGRSNIVGKPLAALLVQKKRGANATVTLAHSQSNDLARITKSADILVAAIGQPCFIQKEMVRPGSIVIDVGINRIQDANGEKRLVGDVDFESVAPLASWITPVPGGVGPMTIAMLMQNTVDSALRRG